MANMDKRRIEHGNTKRNILKAVLSDGCVLIVFAV